MRRTILYPAMVTLALLTASALVAAEPVVVEGGNVLGVASGSDVNHEEIVVNYLTWLFSNVSPKKLKKAVALVPKVVEAAKAVNLDPLLLAVVVSCESSWKPAVVGGVGEVGLMQVHGEATKGFDVATIEGNLAAGAAWLASRIEKYGLERGMAAYMGANERARRAAKWRLKVYRAEQLRQGLVEPAEEVTLAAVAPIAP